MRVRVKVIGKGTLEDPLRVNLPTYRMIGNVAADGTVEVEIPNDECTDGKPDKEKIRKKYLGHPLWDRDDLEV